MMMTGDKLTKTKLCCYTWKFAKFKFYLAVAAAFFIVLFIYCHQSLDTHARYENVEERYNCRFFQERIKKLMFLTRTVHDTLKTYDVSHFILYGSIWGPLRGFNGPLPWDYDVDFGTLWNAKTEKKLTIIIEDLKKKDIVAKVHTESGLYKFKFKDEVNCNKCSVLDLFVLKKTWFGLVRRTGYEPWLLLLHYYVHHTFPVKYIQSELPKVKFAGRYIQTPKGGVGIMKYLYRYNWWQVKKPQRFNCSVAYE